MDEQVWATRVADEAKFRALSVALADAVERAIPSWVERVVIERVRGCSGHVSAEVGAAAATAGAAAAAEIGGAVRALLDLDLDEQRASPLHLLRAGIRYPTAVLRDAGMPSVARDPFAAKHFPDDVYDLSPATWADVDPALHDPGLAWGAAKAFIFKARRRTMG